MHCVTSGIDPVVLFRNVKVLYALFVNSPVPHDHYLVHYSLFHCAVGNVLVGSFVIGGLGMTAAAVVVVVGVQKIAVPLSIKIFSFTHFLVLLTTSSTSFITVTVTSHVSIQNFLI